MPTHNFRVTGKETVLRQLNAKPGVIVMSRAVLAEAREVFLLMSMVLGLSFLSLAVACAAVVIADNQAKHVASLATPMLLSSLDR